MEYSNKSSRQNHGRYKVKASPNQQAPDRNRSHACAGVPQSPEGEEKQRSHQIGEAAAQPHKWRGPQQAGGVYGHGTDHLHPQVSQRYAPAYSACRILISYAEILKANSQLIVESLGSVSRIDHLLPYIEGMIYANKPMGLNSLSEFKNMLLAIFGREMIDPKVLTKHYSG
jgi:hypothetical protein